MKYVLYLEKIKNDIEEEKEKERRKMAENKDI